ncbi:MAG: GNAT family N-acetyltransferase [Synechococcus sp. SB0673_bin_10]|nr:GNAT family N-acetyltransferase [Synechococcus sp. SB0675_bin_7]MYI72270.1 GNAT family N-acetyltransferase [Synechococcus sp. SB0673_bin_10]
MSYQFNQNNRQSYLIDTNILIDLEDNHVIEEAYASFARLAASYKVSVFVHEVAQDDIARDRDTQRRKISLSKIHKYQILDKCRGLQRSKLEADFGSLKNDNDVVDATLLHALKEDMIDFLVTEDKDLHDRAQKFSLKLKDRVLFIADAAELLRQTYEPQSVPVRYVEEVKAHVIDCKQPFFDSLRDDYPDFDEWWKNKCVKQHRLCWAVYDNDRLAGLIVRKEETGNDTDAVTKVERILKICTFKVSENKRGIKLGELLLKQVLWYAQKNRYNLTYLTTYKSQRSLRILLEFYGFRDVGQNEQKELIYERNFSSRKLSEKSEENSFEINRKNYPRFIITEKTCGFIIPIQERWHDILYPDLCQFSQLSLSLFSSQTFQPKKPGNTIRKVYLCRAQSNLGESGSVLFFYKSNSKNPPSQAITTLGILENMTPAKSVRELMRLTGGRSVYSERELMSWEASPDKPVKVINYLLIAYIKPINYQELKQMGILRGHAPQSICKIKNDLLCKILKRLDLEFKV